MDGVILIDKPIGWTSFDVVAKIRSELRKETGQKIKVGHAGTLDPFASGLLIVLIGKSTKRQAEFMKLDKVYEVEAELGKTSTTGDREGEIMNMQKGINKIPSIKEIQQVLKRFIGQIEQTPHSFSAIKVGGKRAYELARAGKEVKLECRTVKIHAFTDVKYTYPKLQFTVKVSSGTYIRSLVEDIGKSLCGGAFTTKLRRIAIGDHNVDAALSSAALGHNDIHRNLKAPVEL